ncbi:hypothetical protein E0E50_02470 [Azotobacter chroococcum subsp. isscasi]|nr:hypothetical protein E0E50_02470 [Azotobacter chroococcum subsp. isscasi]
MSRVAASNAARQGAGRRQWSFPCQAPQRRMAAFAAQPEGTGPVWPTSKRQQTLSRPQGIAHFPKSLQRVD